MLRAFCSVCLGLVGAVDLNAPAADGLPKRQHLVYNRMPHSYQPELIHVLASSVKNFSEIMEYAGTNYADRVTEFIIGSVREPCDMYQSMWADELEEGGSLLKDEIIYHGGNDLYAGKASVANAKTFQSWMQQAVHGLTALRFNNSYPDRQVDCWVRYEHYEQDVTSCLTMFEIQGGAVDWATARSGLQKLRTAATVSSQEPTLASTATGGCSAYFDSTTQHLVENDDAFLMSAFNYKCCDASASTTEPHFTSYANPAFPRYFFTDKAEWEKAGIGAESGKLQENFASFAAAASNATSSTSGGAGEADLTKMDASAGASTGVDVRAVTARLSSVAPRSVNGLSPMMLKASKVGRTSGALIPKAA